MRHLKRFKNWLVVVYSACLAFSAQYQNKSAQLEANEPQANHVTLNDAPVELEPNVATEQSEESEVSAQQQLAALEMLDAIAQGTSEPVAATKTAAPPAEVKKTNKVVAPKPVGVSPASVQPNQKTQTAPVVVLANVKQQGTNGTPSESEATTAKYQPGAINEQTAQRLARLLVSEIKLYHKSKTDGEDASEVNIYDMLKEPIDKSRQHYKQRMGQTAIETMPDYFHGELVRSLCGGDASRLGPNYQPLGKTA